MTAGYYGMVAQLDHAIGRVLDTLDERGLADDTLVIVTTDHGEFLGEHQMIFKGPFGYDSLLRVPLLVRGPGVAGGDVVDDPVGTIDLAPTMLARRRSRRARMDGRPRCSTGPREWVLTENDFNIIAWLPMRTLTTTRYKLHRYLERRGRAVRPAGRPGRAREPLRRSGVRERAVRSAALLDDVMNHDVRKEPVVGLVA